MCTTLANVGRFQIWGKIEVVVHMVASCNLIYWNLLVIESAGHVSSNQLQDIFSKCLPLPLCKQQTSQVVLCTLLRLSWWGTRSEGGLRFDFSVCEYSGLAEGLNECMQLSESRGKNWFFPPKPFLSIPGSFCFPFSMAMYDLRHPLPYVSCQSSANTCTSVPFYNDYSSILLFESLQPKPSWEHRSELVSTY